MLVTGDLHHRKPKTNMETQNLSTVPLVWVNYQPPSLNWVRFAGFLVAINRITLWPKASGEQVGPNQWELSSADFQQRTGPSKNDPLPGWKIPEVYSWFTWSLHPWYPRGFRTWKPIHFWGFHVKLWGCIGLRNFFRFKWEVLGILDDIIRILFCFLKWIWARNKSVNTILLIEVSQKRCNQPNSRVIMMLSEKTVLPGIIRKYLLIMLDGIPPGDSCGAPRGVASHWTS